MKNYLKSLLTAALLLCGMNMWSAATVKTIVSTEQSIGQSSKKNHDVNLYIKSVSVEHKRPKLNAYEFNLWYNNGSKDVQLLNLSSGKTSTSYKTYTADLSSPDFATKIIVQAGGITNHNYKNLKVTLAQFVRVLEQPTDMSQCYVNESSSTATFKVLCSDINATVSSDNPYFTTDVTNINCKGSYVEKTITVTYCPKTAGDHSATITIKDAADNISNTVSVSCSAIQRDQAAPNWLVSENILAGESFTNFVTSNSVPGAAVECTFSVDGVFALQDNKYVAVEPGEVTITANIAGNDEYKALIGQSKTITITKPQMLAPLLEESETFMGKKLVTINYNDSDPYKEGATIVYTINGGEEQSYQGAFYVNETSNIEAWVMKDYRYDSEHVSVTYTLLSGSHTRSMTEGVYGPICLPGDVEDLDDEVEFYEATSYEEGVLNFTRVQRLEAGKAYIFNPKATKEVTFDFDIQVTEADQSGIMIGNLSEEKIVLTAESNAAFLNTKDNKIYFIGGTARVSVGQYKAYFNIQPVDGQASAPIRILNGSTGTDTATSLDDMESSMQSVKFYENGQLLIRTTNGVYNMMGQKVR